MTDEAVERLDWENYLVLQAAQAVRGLTSDGIDAVFVKVNRGAVTLHFVAPEPDAQCREDIEDAVFEFGVLLNCDTVVGAKTHDVIPTDFIAQGWREAFRRRGVEAT